MLKKLVLTTILASGALANPQGGTVISGAATISASGKTLTVNQTSDRAILHWQRFENTASETIRFNQPGVTSVALNRVIGIDPTLISGALQSNGQLFLLNPNGIVFGPGSRVNVGGLVASTLNITDADFLNGRYVLLQNPFLELSSVINRGSITAAQGGTVALIAPIVDNSGSIVAVAGRVIIRTETHAAIDTADPNPAFPSSLGRAVRMPTIGLTPLLEDVVNTTSVASADRVVRLSDGTVFLRGAGGVFANGGTIRVDGTAGVNAGSIDIESRHGIALAGGGLLSATAPSPREGSGFINLNTDRGNIFLTHANGTAPGRHTSRAGAITGRTNLSVFSDADGNLEFAGGTMRFTATQQFGAGAPIRFNAASISIFNEQSVSLISDLDLNVQDIFARNDITLRAGRNIVGLPGGGVSLPIDPADPTQFLHVGSRTVNLIASGSVGQVGAPFSIGQLDGFTVTAPGPNNILTPVVFAPVFPIIDTTVGLVDTLPLPRPTYVPPVDAPEPPVASAPVVTIPVIATSGSAVDVVIATPAAPTVSSQPAQIGGRDNILLPALRTNTVKSQDDEDRRDDDGNVLKVQSSDEDDERKR